MDDPFKYQGADMVGFALTFVSLHLLGNRKRAGFLIGAAASVAWGIFSYMAESPATLTANVVFGFMNLRGFVKWTPAPHVPTAHTADLGAPGGRPGAGEASE